MLGLAAAGYAAREYALGLGLAYLVVAIWGFVIGSGDAILSIVPVNTEDNILHLILGLTGLAAGAATEPGLATKPRSIRRCLPAWERLTRRQRSRSER